MLFEFGPALGKGRDTSGESDANAKICNNKETLSFTYGGKKI